MKIGVLGGGLTGLTIASLIGKKHETEVLEKEISCGGLCRSLKEKGFIFDWGGAHILYSKDEEALQFALGKLGKNIVHFHRNNKIYFKNSLVRYPFENGLSDLPLKDNLECLFSFLLKKNHLPKENFKQWLYHQFGKVITEKYLLPYNEKIWQIKAENLSLGWVANRIPQPLLLDVIKSSLGFKTEGYKIQLNAFYPQNGGIFSLIQALEKSCPKIRKKFEVKKITKRKGQWFVSDGKKILVYDKLISTIPLHSLIACLHDIPQGITKSANLLRYNSLISVMIGVNGQSNIKATTIYFPESDLLPNRVAFPENFSPYNVPEKKFSLIAEISAYKNGKVWSLPDFLILKSTIDGLTQRKIINPRNICYTKIARTDYAYVVHDKNYDKNIKNVRNYLENLEITLCGRFGKFEYLNMDACIRDGLEVASNFNPKI